MSDRIHIRDLSLPCIIGTNPWEREHPQMVCLNLTLECDLAPAGRSDDLADTLDYRALRNTIAERIGASRFFLIERLAAEVADLCLADSRVRAVSVTVDKPGALTLARSVAVEIHRTREGRA
jgi:FolB domain-containing protein